MSDSTNTTEPTAPDAPYYLRETITTPLPADTEQVTVNWYGPASEQHVRELAAEREAKFHAALSVDQDGIVAYPHGHPSQALVVTTAEEFDAAATDAQHSEQPPADPTPAEVPNTGPQDAAPDVDGSPIVPAVPIPADEDPAVPGEHATPAVPVAPEGNPQA